MQREKVEGPIHIGWTYVYFLYIVNVQCKKKKLTFFLSNCKIGHKRFVQIAMSVAHQNQNHHYPYTCSTGIYLIRLCMAPNNDGQRLESLRITLKIFLFLFKKSHEHCPRHKQGLTISTSKILIIFMSKFHFNLSSNDNDACMYEYGEIWLHYMQICTLIKQILYVIYIYVT